MNDARFATPMINCHIGHIYVNDFIECLIANDYNIIIAKVLIFF